MTEKDKEAAGWARETAIRMFREIGLTTFSPDIDVAERYFLAAERRAKEECARIAEGDKAAHANCGHEEGYWDGRTDAAIAIRATLQPTSKTE